MILRIILKMDHSLFNSLVNQHENILYLNTNTEDSVPNHQNIINCDNLNIPNHNTETSVNKKYKQATEAEVISQEEHDLNIKDSPAYFFGLFLNYNVISVLISLTNTHMSTVKNYEAVTEAEMRCFIAILYLSGYLQVPRRRMLWERSSDVHNSLVSNAMQRDRFETIFTALNLSDSEDFTKIKPFTDLLNQQFLRYVPKDNNHSLAELNVSINKKLGQKCLKIWCGCIKNGYCVWFQTFEPHFVARNVILNYGGLIQRNQPSTYNLLIENTYLSSVVCDLKHMRVHCSGVDRDKSNILSTTGVDRLESNISLYRISIRSKKSSNIVLSFALDLVLHNAYQIYKTNSENKLDLLAFRRSIVVYYLQHYAKPLSLHKGGRPSKPRPHRGKKQHSDARFDGIRHYVIPQPKQTRCAKCSMKTTTRCQKCDVGVHVKCFLQYHTR